MSILQPLQRVIRCVWSDSPWQNTICVSMASLIQWVNICWVLCCHPCYVPAISHLISYSSLVRCHYLWGISVLYLGNFWFYCVSFLASLFALTLSQLVWIFGTNLASPRQPLYLCFVSLGLLRRSSLSCPDALLKFSWKMSSWLADSPGFPVVWCRGWKVVYHPPSLNKELRLLS